MMKPEPRCCLPSGAREDGLGCTVGKVRVSGARPSQSVAQGPVHRDQAESRLQLQQEEATLDTCEHILAVRCPLHSGLVPHLPVTRVLKVCVPWLR